MIEQYKNNRKLPDIGKYNNQYFPEKHEIMTNFVKYPNRTVVTDYTDELGNNQKSTTTVELNRVPLAFQKEIVKVAVTFLFGNPVTYINNSEDEAMYDACMLLHKNLKFDDVYRQIGESCSRFKECAILVYNVEEPNDFYGFRSEGRIYIKLLTPDIYNLYPVFDNNGNMTSFSREFKVDKDTFFEVYTDSEIITFKNDEEVSRDANIYGKIPVVYFNYDDVEWADVQPAIERLEAIFSNIAESNDRFAFPLLWLKGKVTGQMSQDKSGRVLQLDENSEIGFAQQPNAAESLEKEIIRLETVIRNFTATPDFSFGNLISIANVLASGNGKALFVQPHLKVMERSPMYVANFKRLFNVFKAFLIFNNPSLRDKELDVTPVITPFEIDNQEALVKFAMEANGGQPVWSQQYAMKKVGIDDPQEMIKEIQDEANKRVELTNSNDFTL